MKTISKTLFVAAASLAFATVSPPSLAQTDTPEMSFHQEMERSIWLGVFDLNIPWSETYWNFWTDKGEPIEMKLAQSPDDIRAGRWETHTRTGKGMQYEPIGNDHVAGLVAYGAMKDPDDPTKRWIKIVDNDAFKWLQLPYGFAEDAQLYSLPPYGSGSLTRRTVELAEVPGGPTATHNFSPPTDDIGKYGTGYGFADIDILDDETVDVADSEKFWDTGLGPEASAPKNVWVKVRIYDVYTEYDEMTFRNEDTKVLAEGWMRLYGPDGSYQIGYFPKGC